MSMCILIKISIPHVSTFMQICSMKGEVGAEKYFISFHNLETVLKIVQIYREEKNPLPQNSHFT